MRTWTLTTIVAATMSIFVMTSASANMMHHHGPMVHEQGHVKYITGGVGLDERKVMRRAERKYSLTMAFAQRTKTGAVYYGEADVKVKNSKGHTVLDVQTDGPMLAAKLPAGTYTVWARAEGTGSAQSRTVTIADNGSSDVLFLWR